MRRKFVKAANQNIFYIGFPEGSLHDKLDGRQLVTTDYGYDIMLREGEELGEMSYEEWLKQETERTIEQRSPEASHFSKEKLQLEIERRIREYPLERRTPMQNTLFLSDLKELIEAQNVLSDGSI